jgi:hypothetical protein
MPFSVYPSTGTMSLSARTAVVTQRASRIGGRSAPAATFARKRPSPRGLVRKPLAVAIAGLAAAAPLAAQEDQQVHVVRPGETLWDIARMYLDDPFLWPEIFRLNTDVVEDPARIYPSERLVLPGRARAVELVRGPQQPGDRVISSVGTAPYPIISPGDFYRSAFLAPEPEVAPVGRLEAVISPTEVPLTSPPGILPYDKVYVSLRGDVSVGSRLQFIRPEREIRPNGQVWVTTGMGTVAAVEDRVATVVMTTLYAEVRPGDLAAPAAAFPVRAGVRPVAASRDLQGRVLGFEVDHPIQSTEEIAFLSLGRGSGVREGDEFDVYRPRERTDWGTRPEIPVGRLRVVKVTERTSSARIISLEQPAIAAGLPVRRIARMP